MHKGSPRNPSTFTNKTMSNGPNISGARKQAALSFAFEFSPPRARSNREVAGGVSVSNPQISAPMGKPKLKIAAELPDGASVLQRNSATNAPR